MLMKINNMENNTQSSPELNFQQLKIISHTLGIDLFKAAMSHNLKDKRLPISFYRNYYNASTRQAEVYGINTLVGMGYMMQFRYEYYSVTDKGIKQFVKQYNELVNYRPKNDRNDVEYLKHRINFYCDFYNYNFCNDNSSHILEYAKRYLIDKDRVSHTTEDVILRFKNELRRFLKLGLI